MAKRCKGPLLDDYRLIKERADAAVRRGGIEFISNPWSIPEDLMNCGLAYLVEREFGHECQSYADVILKVRIVRARRLRSGDGHSICLPGLAHRDGHRLFQAVQALELPDRRTALGRLHPDAPQRTHRLD